ncbi:MAG: VWA domain-containing protein [candidate division FCPU426 bacterium]
MQLANPWWLLLLLPVAGLAWLLWLRSRRPEGFKYAELSSWRKLGPAQAFGPDEAIFALFILGLCLLVMALARPQAGVKTEEVTGRGVDIMLCLDTSGSMRAVDFQPQNRLGAAKETAIQFIQARPRDRLGLVVFGGAAQTVCPLTADKKALLDFMRQVRIDMTGVDGTALGSAVALAADRLRSSKAASKVILLLTDGRNNTGSVSPLTAAKAAAALGIKIYAVGAGSPGGGLIPVQDPVFGTRYARMEQDLDEDTLRALAAETGGSYFRAKDSEGLKRIFERINHMEKSDYQIKAFTHYRDLYFNWLAAGWLLLAAALGLRYAVFRRLP